jgi:3-oxoacyl-[acyl-carrier protein] reductase
MELGLRGRKALVTGASRGIGRACAEVLAAEGCDIVIVSRTQADLDAAKDKILRQSNVSVRSYAMDLSDSKNADKLAAECADTDILINNAGAIPRGTIAEIDEARWREAWDLKVFGYINMTRRFYALMAARRSGVIINIIGAAGETVQSSYACGSAGNASLMGFTRALGGTAPYDGMRVVGLNPGPVETDRMVTRLRREATAKLGDPERWRELTGHMAFGRAATATEIANMAAFLASDRSGYTTGTIVTVDGGGTSRASSF